MAFNLMAAIGGAAKRGSEILKEERESAYDLIDQNMTDWTRLGVPAIKERKKLRTSMKQSAEILRSKGFTNDQIAVALYQGKHEDVVNHIAALELAQKENPELKYNPADIITFGPDYQESGKTMDEILDGVMGKVSSGMSTADALADMGGSGLQQQFMIERANAAAAASGLDVGTLRAIATDDLEYGEAPAGGVISIVDPVASKQAEAALGGKMTGATNANTVKTVLTSDIFQMIPGFKNLGTSELLGRELYGHENEAIQRDVLQFVRNKVVEVTERTGRQQLTQSEQLEIFNAGIAEMQRLGHIDKPEYDADGNKVVKPQFEFSGLNPDEIYAAYLREIENADEETKRAAAAAATAAASEWFKKNEPDTSTAAKALTEWQERLQKAQPAAHPMLPIVQS